MSVADLVTPAAHPNAHLVLPVGQYVAGGLAAGVLADAVGYAGAIAAVAAITATSGLRVALDLPPAPDPARPIPTRRR